jgi:hypothetical protein
MFARRLKQIKCVIALRVHSSTHRCYSDYYSHCHSRYHASGFSAAPVAHLGAFGEGGFYKIFESAEQKGAWSVTFRYTAMSYAANGVLVDASSFMLLTAVYYNP